VPKKRGALEASSRKEKIQKQTVEDEFKERAE